MKDRFEELAEQLIRDAEDVRCDLPRFRDGLKTILDAVLERWELVVDECERNEQEEEEEGKDAAGCGTRNERAY